MSSELTRNEDLELVKGRKAIRAIRCLNRIVADLTRLEQAGELEKKFSICLQNNLLKLKRSGLEDNREQLKKQKVTVFWSVPNKGTTTEMTRTYEEFYKDDLDDYARRELLRKIIVELNSAYDSVPFLESLAKQSVGSSYVFNFKAVNDGLLFSAHPELNERHDGLILTQKTLPLSTKAHAYTLTHPLHSVNPFSEFLTEQKVALNLLSSESEASVRAAIKEWCDKLAATVPQLEQSLASKADHPLRIDHDEIASAVSHFALLTLYAVNFDFEDMSYILAAPVGNETPSSMVVFWPDEDPFRYTDIGVPFLLQMILDRGAMRVAQMQRLASASYGLAHPLKHHLARIDFAAGKLREKLTKVMGTDQNLVLQANRLSGATVKAYGFAEMAHLTHFAAVKGWKGIYEAARDGELRFASVAPFDLKRCIDEVMRTVNEGQLKQLSISTDADTRRWLIDPFFQSDSLSARVRLYDKIYEIILFETLSNAARCGFAPDGRTVTARVELVPDFIDTTGIGSVFPSLKRKLKGVAALVITNDVEDHRDLHEDHIRPNWSEWPSGSPTGLSFLSNLLETTECGRLFFRCGPQVGKLRWSFSVAPVLQGLRAD